VAGIQSSLNSKNLPGVVLFKIAHCDGRSSQKPILHMHQYLPAIEAAEESSLAGPLSMPHPWSWLLKPDAMGASAYELRITGHREMTAAGTDEPVPLALTNHKFELAVFYAVWATSLRHAWAPPRP
jgi:hypothetical protein